MPGNGGAGSLHTATRTWTAPWDGAGSTFTLTSRYENSHPLQDVMGIVMAYAWRGTQ